jgi:hypothetical protein
MYVFFHMYLPSYKIHMCELRIQIVHANFIARRDVHTCTRSQSADRGLQASALECYITKLPVHQPKNTIAGKKYYRLL